MIVLNQLRRHLLGRKQVIDNSDGDIYENAVEKDQFLGYDESRTVKNAFGGFSTFVESTT